VVNPEKAFYDAFMPKILSSLALLALLGACSTPFRFTVPSLRFQSPEVNGPKENMSFAGGLQSYNDVELTPAVETIPIHTSPATVRQRFMDKSDDDVLDVLFNWSYIYLNLGYRPAVIPVEFSLTFPSTLGAKVQLIGANADDAKAGNFSLAVTAAWASRGIAGGSISEAETPEPAYYQYDFDRKIYDASAIVGFRFTDSFLLYGGAYIFNSPYSMTQNLSTGTGNISAIKGAANSFGGNVGVQLGHEGTILKLEVAVNKLETYLTSNTYVHGGVSFSGRF